MSLVAQRLGTLLISVVAASTVVFALVHLSGDPLAGFLPPGSSPAAAAAVRRDLGLDQPLPAQLVTHLGSTVRGDFGESWRGQRPALESVLDRLPSTLLLAASALLLAAVVGGTLGVGAAWLAGGWPGRLLNGAALVGQAVPAFWLGTILIIVFAVELRLLPASGGEGWQSLVLPALTLAALPISLVARLLRAELLAARSLPFVQAATAKGLPDRTVWLRHILPNAVLPALAYLGVQAGFFIGGAVVVEAVFAYPGIGLLALQATAERDMPVVHAFVVVVALLVGLLSLGVDVATAAIDPRLRAAGWRGSDGG